MSRAKKILDRVWSGRSDAGIRFRDLCLLLESYGFERRTRGSHHVFRHPRIEDRINLQREGTHAKPYQVRQVRRIFNQYWFTLDPRGTDDG